MRIEHQGRLAIKSAGRMPQEWIRRLLLRWKRSLEQRLAEIDGSALHNEAGEPACGPSEDAQACGASNELVILLQGLSRRYPGRALIAYGSRVSREADAHSDLDVLVVEYDRNSAPAQETVQLQGVEIDVTRVGSNVLLKGLRGRSRHNNNWFLNALRECRIYGDRDGDARRLQAMAEGIWKEGPQALTAKQLEGGRAGLLRLLDSAKKLCARADMSPEAARLARMRCDQVVAQSIYLSYCVRRRWTTSFHRLIDRCKVDYPELYGLWLQYVRSAEHEEAVSAAKRIVEAVHEGVLPPLPPPTGGR